MKHLVLKFFKIFTFLVLILSNIFLFFSGCKKSALTPETDLIPVPPPERSPQDKDSIVVIDDLKFTISSYFWQDFMPVIPPEGPPFYLKINMEIKNDIRGRLEGFSALMATLYYLDTSKFFHNFRLTPAANTKQEETIFAQERRTLIYTNDRKEIFSPQIEQGTKLYGRIMVEWNGKKHLLTSPPADVTYTY